MQIENCKMRIANCRLTKTRFVENVINGVRISQLRVSRLRVSRSRPSSKRKSQFGVRQICNFQFSIFNFQCLLFTVFAILSLGLISAASAQTVPDKIVATVTNGSQATPDV